MMTDLLTRLSEALRSIGLLHSDIEKISGQVKSATAEYKAEHDKEKAPPVVNAVLSRPQAEVDEERTRETHKEERDSKRLTIETVGLWIAVVLAVATVGLWIVTKQAANTAAIAAKAAQQSAAASQEGVEINKRSIESSIAASQLDQRPWVYVSSLSLTGEPESNKEGPKIAVFMLNSGKAMALKVSPGL
jgi:cytoskeletal protein RodZ